MHLFIEVVLSFELIPSAFSKNPAFQFSAFDGSTGVNRASGPRQIAANRDVDAIAAWLMQFQASKSTFDSYRKEAERLLLWSVLQLSNHFPRWFMKIYSSTGSSC